MKDAHKPKVPRFASRSSTLRAPANKKLNNRGKRRLSISLILLVASAVVGGATILWTGFLSESENIEISLETVSKIPANQLQLTGAEYSGVTELGLEYSIKAGRVVEIKEQAGLLHLYEADGWISSKTDGMTTLLSKEAVYNSTTTTLIATGDLKTDMPVSVTGPRIELISEGMVSEKRGEIILFKGQTQVRLKQNR